MAKTEVIEIKPLNVKTAEITIVGDGDLILNKMNDVNAKDLIDKRKDRRKIQQSPICGKQSLLQCTGITESLLIFRKKGLHKP